MNKIQKKARKVISNDNLKNALLQLKTDDKIEVNIKPAFSNQKSQKNQIKKNKNFRDLSGVVLLDKPKDISSNNILQKVKRLFNVKKAGHTGSLDPIATGLLPLCFGKTTKFAQFLLDSDKCYEVVAKFGEVTTTADIEGEIVSKKEVPENLKSLIEQNIEQFKGPQKQVPPMYSALKHKGKPLYTYAREGIEIEREARDINIYELRLLDVNQAEHTAKFYVSCSKGTYIRSLVYDIGEKLNCGAHVQELRRVSIGNIGISEMVSIDELEKVFEDKSYKGLENYRKSAEELMQHLPYVFVSNDELLLLKKGKIISNQLIKENIITVNQNQKLRLYLESKNNFVGVGLVNEDRNLVSQVVI